MRVVFGAVSNDPIEWIKKHQRAMAVIAGTVALGIYIFATTDEPELGRTSALNAVFDSRYMVAGGRTVGALLALYVAVSVAARVQQGQWVKSVGPVNTDVQEDMQSVADSQEDLQQELTSARKTIQRLTARIEATDVLVAQLLANVEQHGGGMLRTPEQGEPNDKRGQS